VSIHAAALHANADSFPVLKAFQDYLEAERQRARRRVTLLSAFFIALMVVVVAGFVGAGTLVFRYMARQQEQMQRQQETLQQALLRTALPGAMLPAAPATPAESAPALSAPAPTVAPAAPAPAVTDPETQRLRDALAAMQAEFSRLQRQVAAGTAVLPPARSPRSPPPSVASPAAAPAVTSALPAAAAVRRPPIEPATVAPPAPPAGMEESTIFLRVPGQAEPIPWRVYLPAP
jgi:hypothetical protein